VEGVTKTVILNSFLLGEVCLLAEVARRFHVVINDWYRVKCI
jgi:hypothetical protein